MKPAKKELIEEITELFVGYEEEYVPGEWEAFSGTGKNRSRLFPMWLRVAAILFIIISVLPYHLNDLMHLHKSTNFVVRVPVTSPVHVPDQVHGQEQDLEGKPVAVLPSPGIIIDKHNQVTPYSAVLLSKNRDKAGSKDYPPTVVISDSTLAVVTQPGQYAVVSDADVPKKAIRPDTAVLLKKQNTIDFLLSEAKTSQLAANTTKKEKSGKWGFGVEIMPTVMKSNLNLGAGITTDYRLSEKFSISSGISILQLEAGTSMTSGSNANPAGNTLTSLKSKQLTATDANLSAIDIPVGLVYHVNKNFYASAGVSYFNVIREKRSNTYETTAEFYSAAVDAATGNTALYQGVRSESVAEAAPESPLKGNSYLGFFNFSLGREQHLFSRYTIIIEPFVKIPVGKLSDQELKLMNSGVKFKLAF